MQTYPYPHKILFMGDSMCQALLDILRRARNQAVRGASAAADQTGRHRKALADVREQAQIHRRAADEERHGTRTCRADASAHNVRIGGGAERKGCGARFFEHCRSRLRLVNKIGGLVNRSKYTRSPPRCHSCSTATTRAGSASRRSCRVRQPRATERVWPGKDCRSGACAREPQ